jgi:hypothetical protein
VNGCEGPIDNRGASDPSKCIPYAQMGGEEEILQSVHEMGSLELRNALYGERGRQETDIVCVKGVGENELGCCTLTRGAFLLLPFFIHFGIEMIRY